MKLHTIFDNPMLSGLGQVDIKNFHYINLCKTCDPWIGANSDPRATI